MGVVLAVAVSVGGCQQAGPIDETAASPDAPAQNSIDTVTQSTAVITIAGVDVDGKHVTVAGYVTELQESGGECTYTLAPMLSGTIVTVVNPGIQNVGTVSCGSVQVPIEQVSKGPWTVSLNYRSSALDIDATPVEMEIP